MPLHLAALAALLPVALASGSRVAILGRQYEIEPLHDTFGVRIHGCDVNRLLAEDKERLTADIRDALRKHKLVVFGEQHDVSPEAHVALCRALGGDGDDCLDEKFTQNHDAGLGDTASGHFWETKADRQADAVKPTNEAYANLPPAVWPISNDPKRGTVNAGDGGFHCDGAWFGDHFRYMSFYCRSQFVSGGGETFFASSNSMLSRLEPEELHYLKGLLVEYTDKMVYPGGNSINPSGGRKTVVPLVSVLEHDLARAEGCAGGLHQDGHDIDPSLSISAFLDPKYWRRVYSCEAARDTTPAARRQLMRRGFWHELVGDDSSARRAGLSAREISGGLVEELSWEEACAALDGINQHLGPSGSMFDALTLPLKWRKDDLGFYCNRALLHRASASTQKRPPGELRLMHRISVKGPEGAPPFYIQDPQESRLEAETAAHRRGSRVAPQAHEPQGQPRVAAP